MPYHTPAPSPEPKAAQGPGELHIPSAPAQKSPDALSILILGKHEQTSFAWGKQSQNPRNKLKVMRSAGKQLSSVNACAGLCHRHWSPVTASLQLGNSPVLRPWQGEGARCVLIKPSVARPGIGACRCNALHKTKIKREMYFF